MVADYLYNLNLKFNNIKAKYEKYEDKLKAHVFNVLPEEYNPFRVSWDVSIGKMGFKELKKEIHWFWKKGLNRRKTQEKSESEEKVIALNAVEKKWKNKSSK